MAREAALGHKRERLCRYIARPAVAIPRLSLSSTGKVIYTLKTPYRDGTTQVAFDRGGHPPWISSPGWRLWPGRPRPKPRVNLTRYHGVLARGGHPPNHRLRGTVTPARRGKGVKPIANTEVSSPAERHAAMTWAQRLKRVFNIDPNAARSKPAAAAVDLSESSRASRTRALYPIQRGRPSTESSLICAIRNRVPPPCRTWHHLPGHHLGHCLFSLRRIPRLQSSISRDATEKTAWHGFLRTPGRQWPE
jgi:hypothetical protein